LTPEYFQERKMEYRVKARPIHEKLSAFYKVLTDGTVENQSPDGTEIVASMRRARVTGPGTIEWYETCYCSTPLRHERDTVYDQYLANIEAVPVVDTLEIAGESFWSVLENASRRPPLRR
jgi:hypothetical protein